MPDSLLSPAVIELLRRIKDLIEKSIATSELCKELSKLLPCDCKICSLALTEANGIDQGLEEAVCEYLEYLSEIAMENRDIGAAAILFYMGCTSENNIANYLDDLHSAAENGDAYSAAQLYFMG